jgi:RNA polymerase sigma-70 factor, ECF subfamily
MRYLRPPPRRDGARSPGRVLALAHVGYAPGHDARPAEASLSYAADLELARRAVARDPEALKRFAERAACVPGYLRRRAQRAGVRLSQAALDDVTQETYLALWRKLPGYRGESRLETWACGFAFHELRRWRERRARFGDRDLEQADEPAFVAPLPDDMPELVERALDQLGPPAEDVIRLKHFEGLTFEGLALRLDLSPNTAKSHYYRGLARLREWLGHRGEELVG